MEMTLLSGGSKALVQLTASQGPRGPVAGIAVDQQWLWSRQIASTLFAEYVASVFDVQRILIKVGDEMEISAHYARSHQVTSVEATHLGISASSVQQGVGEGDSGALTPLLEPANARRCQQSAFPTS